MSSGYDEFVARVKQNILHETIYTDSEGRTIVVIVMEDLFSQFSLKSHVHGVEPAMAGVIVWEQDEHPVGGGK